MDDDGGEEVNEEVNIETLRGLLHTDGGLRGGRELSIVCYAGDELVEFDESFGKMFYWDNQAGEWLPRVSGEVPACWQLTYM